MSAAAAQFQAAKKCSGDANENAARKSASRHSREIATSLDLKIDHQVTTSRDHQIRLLVSLLPRCP
jgi:hypothetical protein